MLDDFRIDGRVALVTGAGKGIGAATAVTLAEAGADVALVARTAEDLESVATQVREHGRRALVLPGDVTDLASLEQIVADTVAGLGGLDILVNNAGGSRSYPFLDSRPEHFEASFRFHIASRFELSRHAVPHMLARGGGTIVNIGSMNGVHSPRGSLVYGTSEGAISHFTRIMAADLGPRIRVNAVLPGAVETDALRWYLDQKGPDVREAMRERTLMRRNGVPRDIATAVLFLVSPAASWITGVLLPVDGGSASNLIPNPLPDL